MNLEEIKREFLFKYDAASNGGPSLNNYEISVCLTQGAKDIYNAAYQTYETSEVSKRILSPFIDSVNSLPTLVEDEFTRFKTWLFNIPERVNYRIKDSVKLEGCISHPQVLVIDKDSIEPALNNPFKQPNKRKVLREDVSATQVKLYSDRNILNYRIEFLKKDTPIVVADLYNDPELEGTESLEGVNTESMTMIPSVFHDRIIDRAVIHAITITRENSLQSNINI